MANKSKAKGTKAETKVVKYLTAFGLHAERQALHGSQDLGDIKVTGPNGNSFIIEVKAGQQTANPNRSQLTEWLRQAEIEAHNADMPCFLVVMRYRRSIEDADVYLPNRFVGTQGAFWEYLKEFAERMSDA